MIPVELSHVTDSSGRHLGIYPGCADDLSQVDVHPVITADQVPVVGLSIFQLNQLKSKRTIQTTFQLTPFLHQLKFPDSVWKIYNSK